MCTSAELCTFIDVLTGDLMQLLPQQLAPSLNNQLVEAMDGGGRDETTINRREEQATQQCQVHYLDLVLSAGADDGRNKTPTQQSAADSNRCSYSYERFIVASGVAKQHKQTTISQGTDRMELIICCAACVCYYYKTKQN